MPTQFSADSRPKDSHWTNLPRITPSSVNDLDCPKKFAELRIFKRWPVREPIAAVAHGIAVHDVLRCVFQGRVGGIPDMRNVQVLARNAVYKGRWPNGTDRDAATDRVVRAVCGYIADQDEEDIAGIIDLERPCDFVYSYEGKPLVMVSAKIDRALVRASEPTRLVITNYKTTRPRIDLKEAFIELWVAKNLYPGYSSYALELDWIDDENRSTRETIEGRTLRGMHAVITEACLSVLTAKDYLAIPGEGCTYCPLRAGCQGLPPVDLREGDEVF